MEAGVKMPLESGSDMYFRTSKIEADTTRPLTGRHRPQPVPTCCYILSKEEGQLRREDGKGNNKLEQAAVSSIR